jgi:hypothetical protein
MDRLSLLYLFAGGLDVHVGHLLTVRVFDEVLGLSHSGSAHGARKRAFLAQGSPLSTPEILS